MIGAIGCMVALEILMIERNERKIYIASIPDNNLRIQKRIEFENMRKEATDHRKALEIAKAGRARNFWGE